MYRYLKSQDYRNGRISDDSWRHLDHAAGEIVTNLRNTYQLTPLGNAWQQQYNATVQAIKSNPAAHLSELRQAESEVAAEWVELQKSDAEIIMVNGKAADGKGKEAPKYQYDQPQLHDQAQTHDSGSAQTPFGVEIGQTGDALKAADTSKKSGVEVTKAGVTQGRAGERSISVEWVDVKLPGGLSANFIVRTAPGNSLEVLIEQRSYKKTYTGSGTITTQTLVRRLKGPVAACSKFSAKLRNALAKMNDSGGAAAEYRAALHTNPDFSQAHYNLGLVLAGQGDFDEAVEALRGALRLQPDDPDAHNAIGQALAAKGDLLSALAEYREALRFRPDFFAAEVNLAKCRAELVLRNGTG